MDRAMREPLLAYVRNGGVVPDGADEERKRTMREIGVRNLFVRTRLFGLTDALERAGVPPIVLKGAHLIHVAYPFGVRPLEDIDLLVDRAHYEQVDAVLRAAGYEARVEGMDLWTHLTFSNKITYMNRKEHPVIPIDVHYSLGPYPYLGALGPDVLEGRTETIETDQGRLRVLAPEALLLHLCLHLFQHHFDDWEVSCCDIVTALRLFGDRLDWRSFEALVREHRLSLPVAYAFGKAAELASVTVPDALLPGGVPTAARERWIYARSLKQRSPFDRYVLQFVTTPGWRNKLLGAAKIVAPSRTQLRLHHNDSYARYVLDILKTAVRR